MVPENVQPHPKEDFWKLFKGGGVLKVRVFKEKYNVWTKKFPEGCYEGVKLDTL